MTRARLCFELPGDMHFYGDPEMLGQIWSTIGYTTQVAANMDDTINMLLTRLTEQPVAPKRNTAPTIDQARKRLREKPYGTKDFQQLAESSLTTFAAFQERRNRFVHDLVLSAPTTAVRLQRFEDRVEYSQESLESLIEEANRVMQLVAQLNNHLIFSGEGSDCPSSDVTP